MHFCNLIFQQIYTVLDLVIILSGWNQISYIISDSTIKQIMFYTMLFILIASVIIQYRAYSCFKEKYQIQYHGGVP
jgi:hypothetical protein